MTVQPEQKATIRDTQGDVQIIRGGYFYPAEEGLELLPGDRIVTAAGGAAVVDFSGTIQDLVVKNGSAASLFVQVPEETQEPEWIVTDLYGNDVFFAEEGEPDTQVEDPGSLYGLFGAGDDPSDLPIFESAAAVGATALIASDSSGSTDDSGGTISNMSLVNDSSDSNGDSGSNMTNESDSGQADSEQTNQDESITGTPLDGVLSGLQSSAPSEVDALGPPEAEDGLDLLAPLTAPAGLASSAVSPNEANTNLPDPTLPGAPV